MADNLASTTLEKLNNLYAEKKSNRKQHQEEYARNQVHTIYFLSLDFYVKSDFYFVKLKIHIFFSFQAELNRLQESVHRLRNDYERCIDSYIVAKAKYEDQYTKVSCTYLKFNVKFVFIRLVLPKIPEFEYLRMEIDIVFFDEIEI